MIRFLETQGNSRIAGKRRLRMQMLYDFQEMADRVPRPPKGIVDCRFCWPDRES
jgi:hypothetical protein